MVRGYKGVLDMSGRSTADQFDGKRKSFGSTIIPTMKVRYKGHGLKPQNNEVDGVM